MASAAPFVAKPSGKKGASAAAAGPVVPVNPMAGVPTEPTSFIWRQPKSAYDRWARYEYLESVADQLPFLNHRGTSVVQQGAPLLPVSDNHETAITLQKKSEFAHLFGHTPSFGAAFRS